MNLVIMAFLTSILLLHWSYATPTPDPGNPAIARCVFQSVPLYIAFRNDSTGKDHIYATNPDTISNAVSTLNYTAQWIVAYVYNDGHVPNVTAFYPLFGNQEKDHYLTTSTSEVMNATAHGYSVGSAVGYVYETPECGSIPLFRLFDPKNPDHIFTTDTGNKSALLLQGYVDQGIAAYVFPPTGGPGSTIVNPSGAGRHLVSHTLLSCACLVLGVIFGELL